MHLALLEYTAQHETLHKYFSHPSFSYFFSNPTLKLKVELQIGERLPIATHLDQSNYLANQKQGEVIKYNSTIQFDCVF
jgi:hypothetical protein